MTKNIKKISYLIIFVLAFVLFGNNVKAANARITSVTPANNKDVFLITAVKGDTAIQGYYVGTSLSTARFYATAGTTFYVSMMNGKQLVWVKDETGTYPYNTPIDVTKACTEQPSVKNATGKGTVEKCMIYTNGQLQLVSGEKEDDIVSCAEGYSRQSFNRANYCTTQYLTGDMNTYKLTDKYCRMSYQYNCVKAQAQTPGTPESVTSYLSGLSISSGTLSPGFAPTTYNYSASVNVSSLTINASINSDGSSFVDGYGGRTVNLNYGKNTIYVKVKSRTGNVTTYTINVNRVDNRNKDNTLSKLSVSPGTLNPQFSASNVKYTVDVEYGTDTIVVDAAVNNGKSSFVKDFGPRTVKLNVGANKIDVKVKSESGATKTYTITVNRKSNTVVEPPKVNQDELALLKSLKLSEGKIDFNENTFEYTLYVNYNVTNVLVVEAKPKNSNDVVTFIGGENLVVGVESQIMVTVEDPVNAFVRTYTVNVIRKEEDNNVSSNSEVSKIEIKNHVINFEQSKLEYDIILKKNEDKLDITVTPEDSSSTVAIEGNQDLKMGSEVTITVTAEDGSTSTYKIKVTGVTKGANVFLVILLVIVIILVLGYIVLRLLGYKVVINFGIITNFFRGIGQKIKNIFDR